MAYGAESPVDLLFVHWNRPRELLCSVARFLEQDLPLRIVVADNGSRQEDIEFLKGSLPRQVRVVELGCNMGWGAAFNVLLRQWETEERNPYCFVSAHDALPRPGCLRALAAVLVNGPGRVGIACAELGVPHLPMFSPVRGPRLRWIEPRSRGTVEPVPFPHGTLMALRRECLSEVGLFDERYFAYGDEIELGLRANRRGWRVMVPGEPWWRIP